MHKNIGRTEDNCSMQFEFLQKISSDIFEPVSPKHFGRFTARRSDIKAQRPLSGSKNSAAVNTIQPQFFSASFFLASFFWATQHQFPLDDRKQTRVSISDTHEAALRSICKHDHRDICSYDGIFGIYFLWDTRETSRYKETGNCPRENSSERRKWPQKHSRTHGYTRETIPFASTAFLDAHQSSSPTHAQ